MALLTLELFETVFGIDLDWLEELRIQKSLNIVLVLLIALCLLLKVLYGSDQKFLSRVVTKHDTSSAGVRKYEEAFVHTVEQLNVSHVVRLHSHLLRRDVKDYDCEHGADQEK